MLEELKTIIEIQGVTEQDGLEARRKALEHWIDKYVSTLTVENSIIKKRLTAEDSDFIKHYLGYQIAEKLLEDHATVITEDNKIRVKVLVLNKDFPKNKD